MNTKTTVTPIRPRPELDAYPKKERTYTGGRRWGYPLEFKMKAIRMVREQGMPIRVVTRTLDIAEGTLKRWLDYFDLKRIPPKGGNEYPQAVQEKPATTHLPKEPVPELPQNTERKDQIRDAIGLLKQAVDLLHTACQPKQAA